MEFILWIVFIISEEEFLLGQLSLVPHLWDFNWERLITICSSSDLSLTIYIYIYICKHENFFFPFLLGESLDLRVLNRKDLVLFFLFIPLWLFEFIKIILLLILEELWVNNSMNGQILFLILGSLYQNFLFGLKVRNYLRSEVIFFQNSRGVGK